MSDNLPVRRKSSDLARGNELPGEEPRWELQYVEAGEQSPPMPVPTDADGRELQVSSGDGINIRDNRGRITINVYKPSVTHTFQHQDVKETPVVYPPPDHGGSFGGTLLLFMTVVIMALALVPAIRFLTTPVEMTVHVPAQGVVRVQEPAHEVEQPRQKRQQSFLEANQTSYEGR